MASDFDQLRRKLAQAIHTGDCKSARVLGAKLQFAARTPSERGAVHRAQSRLRSCVTGLSGARGRHKKLAARKRLKRANKLKRHPKPLIMKWGKAIDYDTKMALFPIDSSGHTITLGRRRSGLSGPGVVRFLSSKSARAAMNREGLTLREWVNAARFGTNIHGDASRDERAAWRASEDPTDFYRR